MSSSRFVPRFLVYAVVGVLALVAIGCPGGNSSEDVRVSGEIGKGKWPLRSVSEGEITCQSRNGIPLVLFKAPDGRLYGINGAGMTFASKLPMGEGPLEDIKVDRRLWAYTSQVSSLWLRAGLALCKGDRAEAKRLIAEANRVAQEPMPGGVEFNLSSAPYDVKRRQIYYELAQCQGVEDWMSGGDYSNMTPKEASCFAKLQEKRNATKEDIIAIVDEGSKRAWPLPFE